MGQIHFDKNSRAKKLLTGKGFYLALAVCLVAVGGVAVVTFMNTLPTKDSSSSAPSSTQSAVPTSDHQVDKPVTNIPDDRTTATTTTAPTTTTPEKPVDNKPALFVLPLSNEVLVPYSDGKQVYSKTMNDWRTHNGVDFKGTAGQEVKALADGTILSVEEDSLWGDVVVIDHGYGIQSRYCGLKTALKKGDPVKVNEVIGSLSDIPCELLEEPHLHLEILLNGEYQDPVKALGRDVKYTENTTTTAAAS